MIRDAVEAEATDRDRDAIRNISDRFRGARKDLIHSQVR